MANTTQKDDDDDVRFRNKFRDGKNDKPKKPKKVNKPRSISEVFNSVMKDIGLNKGEQQKADRDRKIKEGGG